MQTKKQISRKSAPRHGKKNPWRIRLAAIISIFVIVAVIFASSKIMESNHDKLLRSQYPTTYEDIVDKYSEEYNVDKNLIFSIIRTESSFQPDAGSTAGALGLMQIIPETFEWLQMRREVVGDYVTEDLFEPEINIDFGTYFLSYLLNRYESELTAVAAYNAGFGAVDEWLENPEYSSDGVNLDYIPFSETEAYVQKVEAAKEVYIDLYDFNGGN